MDLIDELKLAADIAESEGGPTEGNGPVDRRVGRQEHDPNHPYVRKLIGCGHGRLFSEPCQDCEIVGLHEQYRNAIRTVQIVRDRLRSLGAPLPGRLAP